MSAIDIQGRDAFSATSGTSPVNFAPINLGIAAGAGATTSTGGTPSLGIVIVVILAIAAVFLVR